MNIEKIPNELLIKVHAVQVAVKARYFVYMGGDLYTFHYPVNTMGKQRLWRAADIVKKFDELYNNG